MQGFYHLQYMCPHSSLSHYSDKRSGQKGLSMLNYWFMLRINAHTNSCVLLSSLIDQFSLLHYISPWQVRGVFVLNSCLNEQQVKIYPLYTPTYIPSTQAWIINIHY